MNSKLFRGDAALEACLVNDKAHLVVGTRGSHIPKIQRALVKLDGFLIDISEVTAGLYGPTTAKAVLNYKTSRGIINFSYQTTPDNIVGKMTIATLDRDMVLSESRPLMLGCLNERTPGAGAGASQSSRFGITAGSTTTQFSPVRLKVALQNAITPTFGVDRGRPILQLFARARLLLVPHQMTLDFAVRLKSFPHPAPVTPNVASDAESLFKAAKRADAGSNDILRVIFCDLEGPERLTTTGYSAGRRVGVDAFPNFVILNPAISHPDHGTLLHEMIHTSDDSLMFFGTLGHDTDTTSVFSHGENRPILRDEHAALLRKAFFAG
ncbi:MAG: hypothetical protein ABI791_10895 [Acidobacteriota bacterium]